MWVFLGLVCALVLVVGGAVACVWSEVDRLVVVGGGLGGLGGVWVAAGRWLTGGSVQGVNVWLGARHPRIELPTETHWVVPLA